MLKMVDVDLQNYSRFDRERHGYRVYSLCIFLNVPMDALDKILAVEYILDPSFPDPVRRNSDRDHCFALQTEAWGAFGMQARIFLTDHSISRANYRIKLKEDDWPRGPKLEKFSDEKTEKVYNFLFDEKYEWRKLSTLARRTGFAEKEVEEMLIELGSQGYVRKAYFKSIDKQDLWGATYNIRSLPFGSHIRPVLSLRRPFMRGEDVRRLQVALDAFGFPIEVDGEFGPSTERTVIDFQNSKGLTSDGVVGPCTRTALGL